MAGRIFVNYRRGDEPGFAGRLYDRLESAFEPSQLFMDVDNIPAGHDFVRVLEDEVGKCDVLLAIIGKGWIDARDEAGLRRLDNPNDFVRIEIESGLKLGKRVIPVLVNNADMPRGDQLPETLKSLSRRNAVQLTHDRFKADAQGLVKVLEGALDEAELARAATSETERRAAEAAAKRKQEEEAERAAEAERQAEVRAREQKAAGLAPEEIQKEAEFANWRFVERQMLQPDGPEASVHISELRNHLARFPGGETDRYARTALEDLVWKGLGANPPLEALDDFLSEFPTGRNKDHATARRDVLRQAAEAQQKEEELKRAETEAWAKASSADTVEAYENFRNDFPQSEHTAAARKRAAKLKPEVESGTPSYYRSLVFALLLLGGAASFLKFMPAMPAMPDGQLLDRPQLHSSVAGVTSDGFRTFNDFDLRQKTNYQPLTKEFCFAECSSSPVCFLVGFEFSGTSVSQCKLYTDKVELLYNIGTNQTEFYFVRKISKWLLNAPK